MNIVDQYFEIEQKLRDHFEYVEDWRAFPWDDSREYYWSYFKEEGVVRFSESLKALGSNGDYYEDEIFTYRHLEKWVYKANGFTMMIVDTHTDGNKFLRIFDDTKQI